MAIDKISSYDSILVLNGDQVIDIDFAKVLDYWKQQDVDGGLVTFPSVHPRWSYARIENDEVVQTSEKNPISKHAIAGYYYFKNAAVFLEAALRSIKKDVQIDGMFFISPVMNELVLMNKKVKTYPIAVTQYHSLYSPQMLSDFERVHL